MIAGRVTARAAPAINSAVSISRSIGMLKTLLTGLAAATLLSSGVLDKRVDAMTLATPAAAGVSTLVQQAHAVCGNNGCVQIQVSGPKKHRTHP
jgi:hypothetical protein